MADAPQYDLLVVGAGINGAGIARDAAGRGLSVLLVDEGDLGGATSSASSKLVHGGLRYLEQLEFRLVHEALAEREVLLKCAPHLVRPMRFVMPYVRGLRPAWLVRAGLLLYDFLARRDTLPGSGTVDLRSTSYGAGLEAEFRTGFVYADCQVDDARLVIANARDARDRGAEVLPRTKCVAARRGEREWKAQLSSQGGGTVDVTARALVNATGPWAGQFLDEIARVPAPLKLRLVKGSHIVVPRLYPGEHAFILQNEDRRVLFAYNYEEAFTLIGTTDVEADHGPGPCAVSRDEIGYLCRAVNRYFAHKTGPADVVHAFCGIRPLIDDGKTNPAAISRDYELRVDDAGKAPPLLSVFGGKITTYRRLAEAALARLAPRLGANTAAWTATAPLPGGAMGPAGLPAYVDGTLRPAFPWASTALLSALARRHGARAADVLGAARSAADLGAHFGANLHAREIDYFIDCEWARSAEDVLWRRTKAGLHLDSAQSAAVARYVSGRTMR